MKFRFPTGSFTSASGGLANHEETVEIGHLQVLSLEEAQSERRDILSQMLVSLFEKAYIILYQDNLGGDAKRRWMSWEDDMQECCRREDFRALLPSLLEGEDDAFSKHILAIARQ